MKIKKIGASLLALSIMAVGTSTAFAASQEKMVNLTESTPAQTTMSAIELKPAQKGKALTKIVGGNSIAAIALTPASSDLTAVINVDKVDMKDGANYIALTPSTGINVVNK